MKTKDTVIDWEEQYKEAGCMENLDVDKLLETQAEASFKAGRSEGAKGYHAYHVGSLEGKEAGIREVVEWLIKHDHPILNKRSNCLITSGEWQAKKKEWGL